MASDKAAEWVDPSTLVPWKRNPRQNDHAVDPVADSIRRYGFGAPIVARAADRSIIAGHTRVKAAAKLGLERIPVRFLDIGEREAHELALVDNKSTEMADWDEPLLRELISEGFDLSDLGWADEELRNIPSFEPISQEGLSDLDVPAPKITCPACGHEFER